MKGKVVVQYFVYTLGTLRQIYANMAYPYANRA